MDRNIKIVIKQTARGREITDAEYAHLANTLWMVLRNTPFDFAIKPDGKTPNSRLNAAWDQYGVDARWEGQ